MSSIFEAFELHFGLELDTKVYEEIAKKLQKHIDTERRTAVASERGYIMKAMDKEFKALNKLSKKMLAKKYPETEGNKELYKELVIKKNYLMEIAQAIGVAIPSSWDIIDKVKKKNLRAHTGG